MAVTRIHIVNMILLAIAGVVILILSLITANSLIASGQRTPTAGWKFYLGRKILPDNVLYPVLMVGDKLKLDSAEAEEQVPLKLEYAEERYNTVQELVKRHQISLAISTLTKYQKYTISAGYQVLDSQTASKLELEQVKMTTKTSLSRAEAFSLQHSQHDLSSISQLQEETRVLLLKIDERLAKI